MDETGEGWGRANSSTWAEGGHFGGAWESRHWHWHCARGRTSGGGHSGSGTRKPHSCPHRSDMPVDFTESSPAPHWGPTQAHQGWRGQGGFEGPHTHCNPQTHWRWAPAARSSASPADRPRNLSRASHLSPRSPGFRPLPVSPHRCISLIATGTCPTGRYRTLTRAIAPPPIERITSARPTLKGHGA